MLMLKCFIEALIRNIKYLMCVFKEVFSFIWYINNKVV